MHKEVIFMAGNTKMTTVRWPAALYSKIEREAEKKGLPVASYIRMIVKERMDAIEEKEVSK